MYYLYLYVYFRRIAEYICGTFESKHVALASVFIFLYLFFRSTFGRRKVHFGLDTKNTEANAPYFILSLVSIGCIFKLFGSVLSLKIVFTRRFVAINKKKLFWTTVKISKKAARCSSQSDCRKSKKYH